MTLEYRQVDVFAEAPLSGNGLAVVITDQPLDPAFMQALTCELRQFETIFLVPEQDAKVWTARVFTMEEELPFAGHPVLGAAAVLHERAGRDHFACLLRLEAGVVQVESRRSGAGFRVSMEQARPTFGAIVPAADESRWLDLFGLAATDRDARMPICVASTGLPYLVIPVTSGGLARGRIATAELEARLAEVGAKFAYLLDVEQREGRTWDNLGAVEDIATGSAAGPVAALLVRHGLASAGEPLVLRQGRFVGRPSEMELVVRADGRAIDGILLAGGVVMVARGAFDPGVRG